MIVESTRQNPADRLLSGRHRGHQLGEPDDVEHPAKVIRERGQAELGADLLQAPHQKRALVHPLLDGAKWVLDGFATPVKHTGPLC
jgi:hypothetical protein